MKKLLITVSTTTLRSRSWYLNKSKEQVQNTRPLHLHVLERATKTVKTRLNFQLILEVFFTGTAFFTAE